MASECDGGGTREESPAKRRRVNVRASESDSIFTDFPEDFIKQLSHICGHYLCWPGTQRNPVLTSLQFINSNAADENEGITFSKAYCSVKPTNTRKQVFGSIFVKGIDMLLAYFTDRRVPENTQERHVLGKLLGYLLDTATQKQNPLRKLGTFCETEQIVILANHLFGKLATSSKYVIDKNFAIKKHGCPCGTGCNITGYYGATSIGNEDVWHGNLDIILNQELGISHSEKESSSCRAELSMATSKKSSHLSRNDQIIAETVVFSFLQQQCHPESAHFLCPCIGVANTALVFYFHDSEHDILLESSRIPLLDSELEINLLAIISSWLVVNYKYLSSGLPESLKGSENAGFFCQAKEKIETYRSNLKFGNIDCSPHVPEISHLGTDTDFLSDARSKFFQIAFETN
ncbi:uncharacterized protein LOC117324484 [Pecten maximus]|uniref:uncharacterized protein LOC117324484 n=1 Tax=Pecten maximus TaxID=6579 RepID=UPI001458BA83|nr:uncharacterized protein LOC117324484 [Pecten maximus]